MLWYGLGSKLFIIKNTLHFSDNFYRIRKKNIPDLKWILLLRSVADTITGSKFITLQLVHAQTGTLKAFYKRYELFATPTDSCTNQNQSQPWHIKSFVKLLYTYNNTVGQALIARF